jgi:hypothetical protein
MRICVESSAVGKCYAIGLGVTRIVRDKAIGAVKAFAIV